MRLISTAATDVGKVREGNEDFFLVAEDLQLYVVADGMGGHQAGEYASQMVVEVIREVVSEQLDAVRAGTVGDGEPDEQSPAVACLREAISEANRRVFSASQENLELEGMGTTVTVVLVLGDQAFVGHVGDSRAYLLRAGQLFQVTLDHSLVAEQVRMGLMTEAQSRVSQYRNIITRSVGVDAEVEVDIYFVELQDGDAMMLCSDGLNGMASDEEIGDVMRSHFGDGSAQALVDLACAQGGEDNITTICLFCTPE
jgi:PPM family protein phosphatase